VRPEGTVSDVLKELRVSGALFFGGERLGVEGVLADCGVCPQSLLELVQSPWELRLLPHSCTLVKDGYGYGYRASQDVESCGLLRHKGSGAVLFLYTQDERAEFAFSENGSHVLREGEKVMQVSLALPWTVAHREAVPALGVRKAWRGIELEGRLREALCDMREYSGCFGLQNVQCGAWTIETTDDGAVISGQYGEWGGRQTRFVLDHEGITCVHPSSTLDTTSWGVLQVVHAWQLRGSSLRTLPPEAVREANSRLGSLQLEGILSEEGGQELPRLPTRAFEVLQVSPAPCAREQWEEWEAKLWEDFDEVFEYEVELPTKKRTKHRRSRRCESYVSTYGIRNTLKCTLAQHQPQPPPRAGPSARPLPPQATWGSPWILRKGVREAEWPSLARR